MTPSLEQAVLTFLEGHQAMTLAVADLQGVPWAVPVFYVNDGFRVCWLGAPTGRLGAYLKTNPRAAATILSPGGEWLQMKGLQLEGRVRSVDSWAEYFILARRFVARFPGFNRVFLGRDGGARVARELARRTLFVLEPERLWLTDHSQGFGKRMELDLSAAAASREAGLA